MPTRPTRRSDYAARIAARRLDAVNAYNLAVSGPKSADARIRRAARDAGVQEETFKKYMTGRYDMGRKGCEALEQRLRTAGKSLADFATDSFVKAQGVWIFANPKRKEPFMPQAEREERAGRVMELLRGIVADVGGDVSSDDSVIAAIAEITELSVNSVITVAKSCSYFGQERMEKLRAKLASKSSTRDISLLGIDPRNPAGDEEEDGEADDAAEAPEEAAPDPRGSNIREFGAVLATLGPNDILVITGSGAHQLFRKDESAVLVLRGNDGPSIHSIPAGCKIGRPTVMQSPSDGSGIVSVPFEPVRETTS